MIVQLITCTNDDNKYKFCHRLELIRWLEVYRVNVYHDFDYIRINNHKEIVRLT